MDRIRESFDSLPVAICFFDKNGVVRLINHRMLMLTDRLRKNGIQTFDELEAALEQPPETVCCLNKELRLYRFWDESVFQFTEKTIRTKPGIPYTQVTACDVTELLQSQNRLQKENERLKDANDRLRKLFEQMPDLIREEETLAMKLRVHDDIGYSILSARRLLSQQAGLDEIRAGAAVWEQSIEVLYRSFKTDEKQDALEEAVRRESGEEIFVDTYQGEECDYHTYVNSPNTRVRYMRVSYLDDDYIGFLQTGYDYWSGAAHGLQYQDFLLFDRQTGEEISVHDLLATSEEEFHNLVAERFEREYPGPDSELDLDYIREYAGCYEGNGFYLGDCYLDETGLVYYFYEYEVAAYASGMPSIRIPYEELEWKIPLKNRISY